MDVRFGSSRRFGDVRVTCAFPRRNAPGPERVPEADIYTQFEMREAVN
jgi:hypothetical protein